MSETAASSSDQVDGVLSHLFGRGLLYTSVFLAQSAAVIVTTPVITRLLPVVGFGQVASVNAVMIFVSAIVGLGLNLGVQQAFADFGEAAARTIATGSCLAVVVLTAAFLATIRWWAPWIGAGGFETAVALGVANAGLAAATLTLTSLLRSQERVAPFVVVGMMQAVGSQVAGVLALVLVRHSAVTYLEGMLIGGALAFVLGLGVVRPRLAVEAGRRYLRPTLRFSLPLVPHALAIILLNLGDRVVVQRDLGAAAVGRYQLAYNIGSGLILLLSVLNQAWEPRLMHVTDRAVLGPLLAQVNRRVLTSLAPAVVIIGALSPFALRLLAPATYDVSGLLRVTLIVTASCLPYAWYMGNIRTLIAVRQTAALVWAAPIAAAVNIALNVVLVPRHGLTGSAAATLICYGLLALFTGVAARGRLSAPADHLRSRAIELVVVACLFGSAVVPQTSPVGVVVRVAATLVCLGALLRGFGVGPMIGRRATRPAPTR